MKRAEPNNIPLILETLNKLRLLETREPLEVLPSHFNSGDASRREALLKEWNRQIEIHQYNLLNCVEYSNRLILNTTEQRLIEENTRVPKGKAPKQYLQYRQIFEGDKNIYFPTPPESDTTFVFITDIEACYIQSVAFISRNNQSYLIAKHSLPDSITYVPGLADLVFKAKEEAETLECPLTPASKFTSPKSISSRKPSLSLSSEKSLIEKGITLSISPVSSSHSEKSESPPRTPIEKVRKKLSIENITRSLQRWVSKNKGKRMAKNSPDEIPEGAGGGGEGGANNMLRDPAFVGMVETKLSEIMQNYMGRRVLRGGRVLQENNPGGERPDTESSYLILQAEYEKLVEELGALKSQNTPGRPSAQTARQEISDLRSDLSNMARFMQSMQLQVEATKLSSEEAMKLRQLSEPVAVAPSLIYKLSYPRNVLNVTEMRAPLNILKAQSVVATIGNFDPDNNPKNDFKETWERIQNYTRNYQLYEHEYVDILMVVMKGSAGSCLNEMIREYEGDLKKILEAIQDIYVPQHTIFEDSDELNKFSRPKGENIRTTMRRASLMVLKLRSQCAPVAWEERRYHMLLTLLRQVIDGQTARYLHGKELECVQTGTRLDMTAIINIVALYEQTHDLIPSIEKKLHLNISTMQLVNQPKAQQSELELLRNEIRQIKSLTVDSRNKDRGRSSNKDRRSGGDAQRSASKELVTTPSHRSNQSLNRTPERGRSYSPGQQSQRGDRTQSDSSRQSQRRSDGRRDYRSPSPHPNKSSDQKPQQSRDTGKSNHQSRDSNKNRDSNDKKRGKSYESRDGNPKYSKTFPTGKNTVTLNFYKCKTCPSLHPQGEGCLTPVYSILSNPLNK